jgi:hypothetical protein
LAIAGWQGDFTGVNGVDMLAVSDQRGHGGFPLKNWLIYVTLDLFVNYF